MAITRSKAPGTQTTQLKTQSKTRRSADDGRGSGKVSKKRKLNPKPKKATTQLGFLALPGEIRNLIYKHALIVPEGLDVTAESAPPEPALLWISRQVRAEARPIFYHENSFTIRGENRSVAPGLKWYKQHRLKLLSAKISVSSLNSHITPGRSLFDNLLEYIEAYYKDEIRFSPRQKSCAYPHPRLEKGAARHRFWDIARNLKKSHVPWRSAKEVLLSAGELAASGPFPDLKPEQTESCCTTMRAGSHIDV